MPDSRIVKHLFGTYLSDRDNEGSLQEPKKQIALKYIQEAEKASGIDAWAALAQKLSDEMITELEKEAGSVAWLVRRLLLYPKSYYLYNTLHAVLAYIVTALEEEKAWANKPSSLKLNKNFEPAEHLNFFNNKIKGKNEINSWDAFIKEVLEGRLKLAIFDKLKSEESKSVQPALAPISAQAIQTSVLTPAPTAQPVTSPAPVSAPVSSPSIPVQQFMPVLPAAQTSMSVSVPTSAPVATRATATSVPSVLPSVSASVPSTMAQRPDVAINIHVVPDGAGLLQTTAQSKEEKRSFAVIAQSLQRSVEVTEPLVSGNVSKSIQSQRRGAIVLPPIDAGKSVRVLGVPGQAAEVASAAAGAGAKVESAGRPKVEATVSARANSIFIPEPVVDVSYRKQESVALGRAQRNRRPPQRYR